MHEVLYHTAIWQCLLIYFKLYGLVMGSGSTGILLLVYVSLGQPWFKLLVKRSTIEIARETTNLGQTPLNRSQQFSAPYKRLPDRPLANYLWDNDWRTDDLINKINDC